MMSTDTVTFLSKDTSHIHKFDGNNFQLWKFQVLLIQQQYSLTDLVLGKGKKPDPVKVTVNGVETEDGNTAESKAWQLNNRLSLRVPQQPKCGAV